MEKIEIRYSKIVPCLMTAVILMLVIFLSNKLITSPETVSPTSAYAVLLGAIVAIWRITASYSIPAFKKQAGLELNEDLLIDHSNHEEIEWANIDHFELEIHGKISVHLIYKNTHAVKYVGFWKQKLFYGSPIVITSFIFQGSSLNIYRALNSYLAGYKKQEIVTGNSVNASL